MGKVILGILVGIVVSACGTPAFNYKFYALDSTSYVGWLRGPKPENDLDLRECEPHSGNKAPCMVVKTRDYLILKKDYLDTKIALETCERGQ